MSIQNGTGNPNSGSYQDLFNDPGVSLTPYGGSPNRIVITDSYANLSTPFSLLTGQSIAGLTGGVPVVCTPNLSTSSTGTLIVSNGNWPSYMIAIAQELQTSSNPTFNSLTLSSLILGNSNYATISGTYGQATLLTIPDPGTSAAAFILSQTGGRQSITSTNTSSGVLTVDGSTITNSTAALISRCGDFTSSAVNLTLDRIANTTSWRTLMVFDGEDAPGTITNSWQIGTDSGASKHNDFFFYLAGAGGGFTLALGKILSSGSYTTNAVSTLNNTLDNGSGGCAFGNNSAQPINLGVGTYSGTVAIGNNSGNCTLSLQTGGSGVISIQSGTNNGGTVNLCTGSNSSNTLNICTGSTWHGTTNIGTGGGSGTINIGNISGPSVTNHSGTFNISTSSTTTNSGIVWQLNTIGKMSMVYDTTAGIQIKDLVNGNTWLSQGGTASKKMQTAGGNILDDGIVGGSNMQAQVGVFAKRWLVCNSSDGIYFNNNGIVGGTDYFNIFSSTSGGFTMHDISSSNNPFDVAATTNVCTIKSLSAINTLILDTTSVSTNQQQFNLNGTAKMQIQYSTATGISIIDSVNSSVWLTQNNTVKGSVQTLNNVLDDGGGNMIISVQDLSAPQSLVLTRRATSTSYNIGILLQANALNAWIVQTDNTQTKKPDLSFYSTFSGTQVMILNYDIINNLYTANAVSTHNTTIDDGGGNLIIGSNLNIGGLTANTLLGSNGVKTVVSASISNSNGCNFSYTGSTLTAAMSQDLSTSGSPQLTNLTISTFTASRPVLCDGSKKLISGLIDLASASQVTGIVPVLRGGTNTNTLTGGYIVGSTSLAMIETANNTSNWTLNGNLTCQANTQALTLNSTSTTTQNGVLLQVNGTSKVRLQYDTSNGWELRDMINSSPILWQNGTTQNSVQTNNNVLDDGSSNMVIGGNLTLSVSGKVIQVPGQSLSATAVPSPYITFNTTKQFQRGVLYWNLTSAQILAANSTPTQFFTGIVGKFVVFTSIAYETPGSGANYTATSAIYPAVKVGASYSTDTSGILSTDLANGASSTLCGYSSGNQANGVNRLGASAYWYATANPTAGNFAVQVWLEYIIVTV